MATLLPRCAWVFLSALLVGLAGCVENDTSNSSPTPEVVLNATPDPPEESESAASSFGISMRLTLSGAPYNGTIRVYRGQDFQVELAVRDPQNNNFEHGFNTTFGDGLSYREGPLIFFENLTADTSRQYFTFAAEDTGLTYIQTAHRQPYGAWFPGAEVYVDVRER